MCYSQPSSKGELHVAGGRTTMTSTSKVLGRVSRLPVPIFSSFTGRVSWDC